MPWYQPETAYEIFRRVTGDLDVATGAVSTKEAKSARTAYSSVGPADAFGVRHKLPPMPQVRCYLLSLPATCPSSVEARLKRGEAIVKDYIVT